MKHSLAFNTLFFVDFMSDINEQIVSLSGKLIDLVVLRSFALKQM